jgi:hypothetical protein
MESIDIRPCRRQVAGLTVSFLIAFDLPFEKSSFENAAIAAVTTVLIKAL